MHTQFILFGFIALIVIACGKPADEKSETENTELKSKKDADIEALDEQNELQQPGPFKLPNTEDLGRFIVTQVGTRMCYRTWETNPTIDFHECNVCFNNTHLPESTLSKNDHVIELESCFSKYLMDTEYIQCLPMLRDPTIPNKPYDILVSEPPFDFSFRNFARCAHGIVIRQEGQKCVQPTDVVTGLEPFLEKFACLVRNLIVESRRFSEANLKELLGSVPTTNGNNNATSIH